MKLLVTGNIGYITTEFIEEAFPECQILLLGETEQKSNRNKSLSVYPMPKTEEEFKDIFKTYEFEGVIYFSNYLTFHGTMEGEIETLRFCVCRIFIPVLMRRIIFSSCSQL